MKFIAALVAVAFAAVASADQVSYDPSYDVASQSMDTVSCSDGANGLITRFGFQTFGDVPKFPFIGGAAAVPGWNSPNCGTCWQLTYAGTGNTINVLAIDHAGSGFNIAQEAMDALTNGQSVQLGIVDATAVQVDASVCGLP